MQERRNIDLAAAALQEQQYQRDVMQHAEDHLKQQQIILQEAEAAAASATGTTVDKWADLGSIFGSNSEGEGKMGGQGKEAT